MGRVEYRVELIQWQDKPESRLDQLVERLNELSKDGWHTVSVDLTGHDSFGARKLPVLLKREVQQ
jgi:hypothetical protein